MNRRNALGRHLRGRNMYMGHRVSVFDGTFLRIGTACGRAAGRRDGEGLRRKAQEPREMSEKNSNMPRNSGGRAWNASEPLDCASVAYFSRTSDIAPASFFAL